MKITESQVRDVAELATLRLTDEEISAMAKDMDEILVYMDKLSQLDTTGVEPMAQVLYDAGPTATWRDDVEHPERKLDPATATANAPTSGQGHYKVPKVIER